MDKEKLRELFLAELEAYQNEYNIPQQEIDKVILDYDGVAEFLEDEEALRRYGGQLIDMTAYRANAGKSPNPYDDNDIIPSVTDDEIEMAIDETKKDQKFELGLGAEYIDEDGTVFINGEQVSGTPEQQAAFDKEMTELENQKFDEIIDHEMRTHWWRYHDNWDEESRDYMERYTTGDLTDEEMQQLKDDQARSEDMDNKIADAQAQYEAELEETAKSAGITDTKGFKVLVQAGTKILQAIDEELIYSPLLLAERGLNKLGLGLAGTAVGGLTRAALVYEDFLFKANVGIAALAHGSLGMEGTASRLPSDIANGILGLYGAGMPEQIVPEVEGGMSKKEQAKRHKTMFANQMYQYSRMSPSFRLFTDVIGPKTGITDPIQGWKNFGKMLGGNE